MQNEAHELRRSEEVSIYKSQIPRPKWTFQQELIIPLTSNRAIYAEFIIHTTDQKQFTPHFRFLDWLKPMTDEHVLHPKIQLKALQHPQVIKVAPWTAANYITVQFTLEGLPIPAVSVKGFRVLPSA